MASQADMNDFLIAADLTLYANPLNAALQSASSSAKEQPTEQEQEHPEDDEEEDEEEEEEPIAADLTKYESPLEELEKVHIIKELNHEDMFQYVSEGSADQQKQSTDLEQHQNEDDNQVQILQQEEA